MTLRALPTAPEAPASPQGSSVVSGACSMASLVEARRDGRLAGRDASSLDRHVAVCAECRQLERRLEELRALLREPLGAPVTPLEHQRGRLALLRFAADVAPPKPARRETARRGALALLAVGATAAALGFAAMVGRPSEGVPRARLALAERASDVARTALLALPSSEVLATSPGAEFERHAEGGVERVALHDGTVAVRVRKLTEGERFIVATEDAEVEVRGTVFEVEARRGRIARVEVTEGRVEVRHRGAVSIVPAGGEWEAALPSPDEVGTSTPVAPTPAIRSPRQGAGSISSPRQGAGSIAVAVTRGARVGGKTDEGAPADDASKAFGRAVDVLGQGDYAAARAQLEAFQAAHPSDDRADLAAFLAVVSLHRAGREAEARAAAQRYLQLYPRGDRRAEALQLAASR